MNPVQSSAERIALLEPIGDGASRPEAVPGAEGEEIEDVSSSPRPRIGVTRAVARGALMMVGLLSLGLVVDLVVVSPLTYRAAQVSLLNTFRSELALGTAPLGSAGSKGKPLPAGTPIALIEIPSLGLRSVVLEGTTGSVLARGPGFLRDSVFPGGAGTSVVLGRATAYGGPFGRIATLRKGQQITVVTQLGTAHFRVIDVRRAGAKFRPPAAGTARLTLGTASGSAWVPTGVVWVDATKVGAPLAVSASPRVKLAAAEYPMAIDTSTLWEMLVWIEVLAFLMVGAVWSWRRWGRAQAWIVFTAPILLAWSLAVDQVARLLPNLL